MTEALTVAQRPDRRSAVLRTLGAGSLLFRTELATPNSRSSLEPVHLYLDVSGSVQNVLPAMYAATRFCRELLHGTVHLFSTRVHDMPLHRVVPGECKTTGGTDIGCVAAHIRKRRVRRAVILTDGAVGRPGGENAATLRSCLLGVAFAPGYCIREDLAPYANLTVELKGVK